MFRQQVRLIIKLLLLKTWPFKEYSYKQILLIEVLMNKILIKLLIHSVKSSSNILLQWSCCSPLGCACLPNERIKVWERAEKFYILRFVFHFIISCHQLYLNLHKALTCNDC